MTRPIKKEATIYDLQRTLSMQSGLTVKQAREMIILFLAIVKQELMRGRPVKLWDFGRFGFRMWTGRTPYGGYGYVPSRLVLKFHANKDLRKMVSAIPISDAIYQKPAPRGLKRPPRKVNMSL